MRVSISISTRTAVVKCDKCSQRFDSTLAVGMQDSHYCWQCRRILASTPTRDKRNLRQAKKDRKAIWDKLKCFNMEGTGIESLDRELKEEFGNWSSVPKPIWGT